MEFEFPNLGMRIVLGQREVTHILNLLPKVATNLTGDLMISRLY